MTAPRVSLRTVRAATSAMIQNESVTRERVEQLEAWATSAGEQMAALARSHAAFTSMGFWARLRWLMRGH
jgi:hypothetical protein